MLDQKINFNKKLDYVIIAKKDINEATYEEKTKKLQLLFTKIDGAWKDEKV